MTSSITRGFFCRASGLLLVLLLALNGCSLPRSGSTPAVYDFGPGALQSQPSNRLARLPTLELGTPQASAALNSVAVQYRLGYADEQQLKPYMLARWSMPPAQLIGQRLRAQLSLQRTVLAPGELIIGRAARPAAAAAAIGTDTVPASPREPLLHLRLELEEFSQLFDSPSQSSGLLRLRATLTQRNVTGDVLLGQRTFIARQAAATADASGGVRALTAATDQAIAELQTWLAQAAPHNTAP